MTSTNEPNELDDLIGQVEERSQDSSPNNAAQELINSQTEAKHTQHIKDLKQRRRLRQQFSERLFYLLVGQIVFVAALIFIQGFKPWGFSLDKWAFGVFINGSLVQTFFIVRQIVQHLFPAEPEEQ